MMITILIIVAWLICGLSTYAINFSYFQNEWPGIAEETKTMDKSFSILFGLCGPIALLISFVFSDFAKHGLKWW